MNTAAVFLLFLAFSLQANAENTALEKQVQELSREKHLDQDRQWRKLLHFERDAFFTSESQIDSADFFFAKNGKKDPAAELEATIAAFFNDDQITDPNQKAQCRFPARFLWLKNHLQDRNIQWPKASCGRFTDYARALNADSVSLVFSSYFLNNPSSTFGHTFLRLNKPAASERQHRELLDYGVNYAAEPDTSNAFVYGFKGLFGMFDGKFNALPYYFKVRDYNDAESRDLWEYQLRLSKPSVDMLVAHLWELSHSKIDYWYLTENCSYHMISVLEAVDPSVDVLSKLHHVVIPADTVRVLWNQTDLVEGVSYRPSVRQTFLKRQSLLDHDQKKILRDLAQQIQKQDDIVWKDEFLAQSPQSQSRILDALIDWIDYRYAKEVQAADREFQLKLRILDRRSEISEKPVNISTAALQGEPPHLGHPSERWGVGYRHTTSDKDLALLSWRFALHDRMDPATGYPRSAQISFFDFDFSHGDAFSGDGKTFQLENFSVFELISDSPWSVMVPDYSWRFKLGVERTYNENFAPTQEMVVRGGSGWTFKWQNLDVSAQLLAEAHYLGAHSENQLWAGAGPVGEIHYQWTPELLSQASVQYRRDSSWDVKDYFKTSVETQWSFTKNWGLRAVYSNQRFLEQYSLQLFNYL